ncbi:MAG TPA: xanthine dehydrogenase family protein molybdopterin-binding subunit, partial [Acidimicrobiales bacterium]|nr:xanthine dehydrogenase family protein molybdopterin-binding subunit [Acidimicrobiales bacterium]
MSILGNRVLRREDPALLRGEARFVDDLQPPDAVHVTYVTSTMAHARIAGIDVSEALAMPGVLAVLTASDLPFNRRPAPMALLNQDMPRPYLADDVTRYVGEPIVAVVTEELYQGDDAAETVVIDYEPLDVLVDPEDALTDRLVIHEQAGTNVVGRLGTPAEADFSGCDVVVEQRLVNQVLAPVPIEGRCAVATWEDGRLIQWASGQGVHPVRDALAEAYGLDPSQVRVIGQDVGGSFGAKSGAYPEEVLLGHLSRTVGRPVRWTESRTENMTGLGHGRGQVQYLRMGGTREGKITAYQLKVIQQAGAYPEMGAVLPFMTQTMLTGVYDWENAGISSVSVVTNTTPLVAYRGAGRPEAAAAVERGVDLFAAEIGMDPAEVRRLNMIPEFHTPHTTAVGTTYDVGAYEAALDLALDAAGYTELRAEQERRRRQGARRVLGIGISTYVEITAFSGGGEFASVELRSDGSVLARTGSSPFGQGHYTSWAMIVSERTGLPLDRIEVFHGDTDEVAEGGTTGGSRSLQIAGSSVHDAATKLVEMARERAADILEADPSDVVVDTTAGVFHVAGTPAL